MSEKINPMYPGNNEDSGKADTNSAEIETLTIEQTEAIDKVREIWNRALPVSSDSPYIVKKRIAPIGIRQFHDKIIVPIYRDFEDSPVSLQYISPVGEKKFHPGCSISGCFHTIGILTDTDLVYVVEGYATGITVFEATDIPVVVAFNSGNLKPVCAKLKEHFPKMEVVLAADNDISSEKKDGHNSGKESAIAAAEELGVKFSLCPVDSDFNDLICKFPDKAQGLYAVRDALTKTNTLDIYQDIIEEFNQKHAAVMFGGRCLVLTESYDPALSQPFTDFLPISAMKQYNENRTVPDPDNPKKETGVVDYWWKSPHRRSYSGVVFTPGEDIPGYYNLWNGFKIKENKGDWSLYRNHVRDIIADGNGDIYRWIIAWMARIVQDPGGKRPGTAIILRGGKGAGKGTFVNLFGEIFGLHFLTIAHATQVTGRFNHHLQNKVLVFVDEGFWAGDKAGEGIIKNLVTEPTLTIEQKGKDIVAVKNNINLMLATNSDWAVPAGFNERRFACFDVPDHVLQDKSYFGPLYQQMENGGCEAMLYDLMRHDYSDIDLKTIPRTKALMDQQYNTLNNAEKFWYDRLMEGTLSIDHADWCGQIPIYEHHAEYLEFAKNLKDRHPFSKELFGKAIVKLCPSVTKSRPFINGKRCWVYLYPTLEQCRDEFEKATGMEGLWPDES